MSQPIEISKMSFEHGLTPTEADHLITSIIEENINFYKRQYLSLWERNHSLSRKSLNTKIRELNSRKQDLKRSIEKASKIKSKVIIGPALEVKLLSEVKGIL